MGINYPAHWSQATRPLTSIAVAIIPLVALSRDLVTAQPVRNRGPTSFHSLSLSALGACTVFLPGHMSSFASHYCTSAPPHHTRLSTYNMPRTKKRRTKPDKTPYMPSDCSYAELVSQPRWVNHINRGLNTPTSRCNQSPEREKIAITLAGLKGTCKIDKEELIAKSGSFRSMLNGRFKVCSHHSTAQLSPKTFSQESSTGEVTLHDDHLAGIATVLRYIVGIDDFETFTFLLHGSRALRLSVHQWDDLRSDLPTHHMPETRTHLLLLIVLTAEKYMVPGLCEMAVREMAFISVTPPSLGPDGHVFLSNQEVFLSNQEVFVEDHCARAKSMWEGAYPPILYQVFKSVLKKLWRQDAPSDKMEAVAKEDEGLKAYLLADGNLRMRCTLDWKAVVSEMVRRYDGINDISFGLERRR